jgi:hypothetical protein
MVTVGGWLTLLAFLSVALVLAVRFRISGALERQQLKWPVYAAGLMVGCFVALIVIQEGFGRGESASTIGVLGVFGFGMISVAAGVKSCDIASRHRLRHQPHSGLRHPHRSSADCAALVSPSSMLQTRSVQSSLLAVVLVT